MCTSLVALWCCFSQVGDVVLVQDESVMDNEYKMLGLETLVRVSAFYLTYSLAKYMLSSFKFVHKINPLFFT